MHVISSGLGPMLTPALTGPPLCQLLWSGLQDPHQLSENFYWSDKPNIVKDAMKRDYDLHNAKPIWALDPKFGGVVMIFEASPGRTMKKEFYVWNGMEITVFHVEGNWTRETLQKEIEKAKGALNNLKLEEVAVTE